jgi:hypothetical protein
MKITTPKLVLWAVVLISLFIFIEKFTNTVMVITILIGVFFGISFAVLIVYLPLIIYTIRHNIFDRVSQLSIGVGLIWLALVSQRVLAMYNRFYGSAEGAANSPYTEFNIFLAIVGGVLFVSAPGYDNKLPRFAGSNRELMIILGITGGIITTLMYFIGTILY